MERSVPQGEMVSQETTDSQEKQAKLVPKDPQDLKDNQGPLDYPVTMETQGQTVYLVTPEAGEMSVLQDPQETKEKPVPQGTTDKL